MICIQRQGGIMACESRSSTHQKLDFVRQPIEQSNQRTEAVSQRSGLRGRCYIAKGVSYMYIVWRGNVGYA